MHRSRLAATGLTALLVVAGCAGGDPATAPTSVVSVNTEVTSGGTAAGTNPPGSTTPVAPPTSPVPALLQVRAELVGGGSIDFAAYAGRALALWFWAPT